MKLTLLFLALIVVLAYCEKPTGVVEKLYSQDGLKDHYKIIFKNADYTFKQQSLDSKSDSKGWWWIFGTGMSIGSTYLGEYDMGELTNINYSNLEYVFGHDKITGQFKYKWTYRWYVIPFSHSAYCNFTLGAHNINQKFINSEGKFDVNRTIDYTSGKPTLDCSIYDNYAASSWGFDWMVELRNAYVADTLPSALSNAVDKWLDSVDDIYTTTTSATMDKLTFTLGETLNSVAPDSDNSLVLGYDYTIKYGSKSAKPVPMEEVTDHTHNSDLTVYFYEEFFNSLIDIDRQNIPFVGLITDKSLPNGIEFRMKAKDFRYIIDGMQKYSADSDMEADCGYKEDGNTTFTIDTTIKVGLPLYCKLDCGKDHILDVYFDLQAEGLPFINDEGVLSLTGMTYDALNFNATSPISAKILPDYLEKRIESYALLSQALTQVEYFDERFKDLDNLSVVAGKNFFRVSGDYE